MKLRFIPTKEVNYRTSLSVREVLQRIQLRLTASDISQTVPRFEGKIDEPDFEIWEIVQPRSNSFLPNIKGKVLPEGTGSIVRVVLRLNGCAWIFVLVWCYPFALIWFLMIASLIRGDAEASPDLLSLAFILGMPAVMITITTLGFKRGVRSTLAFLKETLGEL